LIAAVFAEYLAPQGFELLLAGIDAFLATSDAESEPGAFWSEVRERLSR
jgi:hypothetical protein